jgi:predicted ATPase
MPAAASSIVDNGKFLIDARAAVALTLLRACPGLTLLASSREPLAIDGETVRQLGPRFAR